MQVVACACEVLCARDLLRLSDATITANARPPNHRIMIRSTGKVHAMRHAFLNYVPMALPVDCTSFRRDAREVADIQPGLLSLDV